MPELFQGSTATIFRNLFVGGTLMAIAAAGTWMLTLERGQADIREAAAFTQVEVAQDYATNKDLDDMRAHMDRKFDNLESLIRSILNFNPQ